MKKKRKEGRRRWTQKRAVPAEQSGPGVDPVAHRTPGRSDVRSALTCWIRRECDAKVSRSVRLRPGSTSGYGEGARPDGMDERTDGQCPPRFRGPVATDIVGEGGTPAPGRVSGTRSPCHAFSAGSAAGSRRFVIRFVGTTVTARSVRSFFARSPVVGSPAFFASLRDAVAVAVPVASATDSQLRCSPWCRGTRSRALM